MQAIRQTQLLNKRELENATQPSASWHADYRDTAWIYVGGLLPELSEGDVSIIFSQFGNPTHLNLIRDKETGKSKGFGFLKYEDQRSCDLAVDNLGGAEVLGRMLRVDHSRYKRKDGEDEETYRIEAREREQVGGPADEGESETDDEANGKRKKKRRKLLKEEKELEEMLAITAPEGEDEDPMREHLIREKREEVEKAKQVEKERRKHKHHHRHRRDKDDAEDGDDKRKRGHRRRDNDDSRHAGDNNKLRGEEEARHRARDDSGDGDHRSARRDRDGPSRRSRRDSRSLSYSRSRSRSPRRR